MRRNWTGCTRRWSIIFFWWLAGLTAFSTAVGGADALAGKLVITGSSTMAPLVAEIGKRFEALHPGVRVDVQTGGSSRGIADTRFGLADIGMVSRSLYPHERDLHETPIAYDGITMIVHRSNPIRTLTHEQIVGIYTGAIRDWNAVGGVDAPITVVTKAEGRSTLELFLRHFGLRSRDIRAHVVIGDNEQGVKTVAGNPHAIGYVSIGTARYDASRGVSIRLLPLEGIDPTVENVRQGRFPLVRTLTLVTRKAPEGVVETFIDFARSPEVYDLVRGQYFVPLAQ